MMKGFNNNSGIAMIIALVVMMILFMLATAYLSTILSETGIARNQENSEKAFFVADGGVNRGIRYIMENPDTSLLPWTVTENMSEGYYTVTASVATDYGADYVRISATGYVKNASRIAEVIVYINAWKHALMSNTDIDFQASADGIVDGDVHANGFVNGVGAGSGIDYISGTRQANNDDIRFDVKNNTGSSVTLTALTATWTSPTAYYEEIRMEVIGGTNYQAVWRYQDAGNIRASSTEMIVFNQGDIVVLPAGATMRIQINNFRNNRTGAGGGSVNMNNTRFTIIDWAGSTAYSTDVGLEGEGANVDITGVITQGGRGDTIIKMPLVKMDMFFAEKTFYYDGDYVFNGIEGQASSYSDESLYITGKVTLDSSFNNLTFNYCSLVAEGGVLIGPQRNDILDYVLETRTGRLKDITFQATNKSGAQITIDAMALTWDGDINNRYQRIDINVIGGTNYGTVWSGNAAKNTKVTFSQLVNIPAGTSISVTLRFSRNTDYSLLSRFYQGLNVYTSTVVKEGWIPNLVFKGRREYCALVTQTGDIIEYGTKVANDMQLQGIIYSERGTVEFQNITLDGAIIANKINLIKNLNIEYKSRYVPNPPPEFISGLSFVNWSENY